VCEFCAQLRLGGAAKQFRRGGKTRAKPLRIVTISNVYLYTVISGSSTGQEVKWGWVSLGLLLLSCSRWRRCHRP
jgi:hypothetical protein